MLWSVVIIDTWQWTPFTTLIIKAGLDSVDPTPIEAATVDAEQLDFKSLDT